MSIKKSKELFGLSGGDKKSIGDLIAAGEYVRVDERINSENFPSEVGYDRPRKVVLLESLFGSSTTHILEVAKKLRLRNPRYKDALDFGAEIEASRLKSYPIIFLHDRPWRDPLDGCRKVFAICGDSKERSLRLEKLRKEWRDRPCNFAFLLC